jgi:hypothetical protein
MGMTIRIAAADTMTQSTLTNRRIVEMMALVPIRGTIAASFPSNLTAAAISVGGITAESTPFRVHSAIRCVGIFTTNKNNFSFRDNPMNKPHGGVEDVPLEG